MSFTRKNNPYRMLPILAQQVEKELQIGDDLDVCDVARAMTHLSTDIESITTYINQYGITGTLFTHIVPDKVMLKQLGFSEYKQIDALDEDTRSKIKSFINDRFSQYIDGEMNQYGGVEGIRELLHSDRLQM